MLSPFELLGREGRKSELTPQTFGVSGARVCWGGAQTTALVARKKLINSQSKNEVKIFILANLRIIA